MTRTNKNNRSKKTVRKVNPQAVMIRDFAPREVKAPPQIKSVEFSIKVPKLIQISVPLPSSGNESINPSMLSAGVPGGLTYWNSIRIEKILVYSGDAGEEASRLTVVVSPQSGWNQPPFQITDAGTVGNERARLGFKLGVLDRARWFGVADTTELCVVAGIADSTVIIQASVELLSPTG